MRQPSIDYSVLTTLFSAINEGAIIIDDAGRIIDANDPFCRLTGFSKKKLVGMRPPYPFWAAEAPLKSRSEPSEAMLKKIDGRRVAVLVSHSDAVSVDGSGSAFLVTFKDITDWKNTEDQLRASEERFRTICENAPVMIDSFDNEGRCLIWNRECEKQLGYTEAEVREMDDPLALAYPDPTVRDKVLKTIMRADGTFREYDVLSKEGTTKTQLWADFRLPGGDIISVGYDITKRKRAEDAIHESEEKYRAIFDEARDGIILMDSKTGQIVDCNRAFEEQSGRTLEELKKMKMWDVRPPEEREKAKEVFETVARTGKGGSSELNLQRPNGEVVPIDFLSRLVTIGGRKYNKSFTRDITLRKKAEDALRASEEKYRAIFTEARDGIVLSDNEGKILDCNPEFENQTGRSLKQLREMHVWELRPQEEVDRARGLFKELLDTGVVDVGEQIFQKPNGEKIVVELRGRRIRLGDRVYNQALTRDVTQRIETARALRDSQEKYRVVAETYRELFEHSNDGIFVYDMHGKILDVNEKGCEMLGYDKTRLLDLRIKRLTAPESADFLAAKLEEMVEKGFIRFEIDLRRKDGSIFPAEVSGSLVKFTDKKVIQGMVRDITERREAEEVLRQSRRQLRALATRLQMVREEESASISREIHDELGQKLTVLKMDLSWMQRRLTEASNGRDAASLKERLVAMVRDVDDTIRSVRRIATQLRPIVLDDLGLVGALEWQAKEFQERTGLSCRFDCTTDEEIVDADRATAVFRIFQEILTNVVRHANAHHVRVDLHSENGTLVMKVDDDGVGISEQDMHDPRALGILGMRERALVCGGSVHVEDGTAGGTSVEVRIPLTQ